MSSRVPTVSAALLMLTVVACAPDGSPVEVKGSCAEVFKAEVCTWAKTSGKNLVEAGATVPLTTIGNAPTEHSMVWPPVAAAVIDMPEHARQLSSLTQLTIFWEAGGHPPGAFMTPHFDFHYYTVPASQRMAMDCKDLRKPDSLPVAYSLPDIPLPPDMAAMMGVTALVGLCVPQMGMHALLASEIERTDPFSGSMVIGYYAGRPIFIEPMLTKAKLMQKQSFDLAIPAIPGMTGTRPTKFRADFDSTKQAYRFIFSEFTPGS